jgi:histidinol-phosphate aminotransferase
MESLKGIRPAVQKIPPYIPGKPIEEVMRELGLSSVIKLASNESSIGPSPLAVQAILDHVWDIHRYPEDTSHDLKVALAKYLSINPAEVLLGTGGDEVLLILAQLFLDPSDEAAYPFPSFLIYRRAVRMMGAIAVESRLRNNRIDVEDLLAHITPRTKLVFLCNPNNPTGNVISKEEVIYFLEHLPSHVFPIIDEAYAEFVTDPNFCDGVSLFREGRGLAAVRTFSKIFGLAGLRIGYAVLPKALSTAADRIRNPFNINRLAQVAGLAALQDHAHVSRTKAAIAVGRNQLLRRLREFGLDPIPSETNFVCVDVGRNAEELHRQLLSRGLIIRPLTAYDMPNCIRITVGTPEEHEILLNTLAELLGVDSAPTTKEAL